MNMSPLEKVWKNIPGYVGAYQVSNMGQVRSLERYVIGGRGGRQQRVPARVLKQAQDSDGYFVVSLCGKPKKVAKVGRLVLLAFIGNSELQCCHGDGDKQNNNLGNLRYGTAKENAEDRTKHGKQIGAIGEKNGVSKLTTENVAKIKDALKGYLSCVKIAKEFGVCPETVRNIKTGKTWSHV